MEVDPSLVVLFVGLAVASVCQALTGIGFTLVAGPVLIMIRGHAVGLQMVIALGLVVTTALLAAEWRHLSVRGLVAVLVPAAVTAPIWLVAINELPDDVAARTAGAVAVLAVLVTAMRFRPRVLRNRVGAVVSGGLSSGLVVAGGVGGPPLIMYAASNGWSLPATRATLNAYFTLFGLVVLALIGPPPMDASGGAAGVGMVGGLLASLWLTGRLAAPLVMRVTLALAGASGLALLVLGAS